LTGEVEREELIAQLRTDEIKHNPDDILRIARLPDGNFFFWRLVMMVLSGNIFRSNTQRILQQGEFLKIKLLMLL
jgi:hypothetical protein